MLFALHFRERVLLCSPEWPWILHGLSWPETPDESPALPSQVLGSQACSIHTQLLSVKFPTLKMQQLSSSSLCYQQMGSHRVPSSFTRKLVWEKGAECSPSMWILGGVSGALQVIPLSAPEVTAIWTLHKICTSGGCWQLLLWHHSFLLLSRTFAFLKSLYP